MSQSCGTNRDEKHCRSGVEKRGEGHTCRWRWKCRPGQTVNVHVFGSGRIVWGFVLPRIYARRIQIALCLPLTWRSAATARTRRNLILHAGIHTYTCFENTKHCRKEFQEQSTSLRDSLQTHNRTLPRSPRLFTDIHLRRGPPCHMGWKLYFPT